MTDHIRPMSHAERPDRMRQAREFCSGQIHLTDSEAQACVAWLLTIIAERDYAIQDLLRPGNISNETTSTIINSVLEDVKRRAGWREES